MMESKQHFKEPFKLWHLSEENLNGKTLEPRPLDRDRVMEGENWKTPRICVSTSIDGALMSLVDGLPIGRPLKFWVHEPDNLSFLFASNKVHRPSTRQVPDAEVTGEHWLKAPSKMKVVGQIEVLGIDDNNSYEYTWLGEKAYVYKVKWRWCT